jgi:hypothetical protein
MPLLISLATLAFSIVTLVDIITRENWQVKHLPKFAWIVIAILIPFIGGILWWTIGREYPQRIPRQTTTGYPATPPAPLRPVDTRTTEQQLADLEREAELERLRAEIARRKRERGEG